MNADIPVRTGKCRAVKNIYDFKVYIEEEWSDGQWLVNTMFPPFPDAASAKTHFERSKKAMKEAPADLGDFNEE